MKTLTEKIKETQKQAFFLLEARNLKLSKKQIYVLHGVAHNLVEAVGDWNSINSLVKKRLITRKVGVVEFGASSYKLNYKK